MDWKVPFNLQLIITEECNLRCHYCFEIKKRPRFMPVALAKAIIDEELSRETSFQDFQIDLAGGEPFLRFGDVQEIVEYGITNMKRWGKRKVFFFICTNLTLLNNDIKNWLEKNREHVILGTSLDGTREAHNRYRCNSYDSVMKNIPYFKITYPEQGVKMTIAPDTVGSVYEGIVNIESMGFKLSANVVYEPVWGDRANKKEYLRQFSDQLDLLVDHYLKNPGQDVPNLLTLPLRILIKNRDPEHSWCGSGKMMRAYDTDGRVLPCHRYATFCTDKIYEGDKSIGPRVPTRCDTCLFVEACPHCPGYNWQINGHPDSRTDYHCEFIKLQFLATAKLIVLKNKNVLARLNDGQPPDADSTRIYEDLQGAYFVLSHLDADSIMSCL